MNNPLDIQERTAEFDDWCDRCLSLGIKDLTILKGDTFYQFLGQRSSSCCKDCFKRLEEEYDRP